MTADGAGAQAPAPRVIRRAGVDLTKREAGDYDTPDGFNLVRSVWSGTWGVWRPDGTAVGGGYRNLTEAVEFATTYRQCKSCGNAADPRAENPGRCLRCSDRLEEARCGNA